MKNNSFKVNSIRTAAMSATLLAANGIAVAAPVSTTLEFECPFPIIGSQTIIAQISADIPQVVDVSETNAVGPIHITTVNIVPDKARLGLGIVDATKITGTATAINNIHSVSEDRPLIAVLDLEPTAVPTEVGPFNLLAEGNAPIVTVDESHVGEVSITVDDLVLNLVNYKENGSIAPAPIGEFEADCALVPGQDNTLVTLEVVNGGIIDPPPLDPADIHIDVEAIDFGTVKMGDPAITKTITITNEGDLDLVIYSAGLTDGDTASFIESHACTTIAKDASCTIEVTYLAANAGTKNATIEIQSNDEDESTVPVTLTGTADIEVPPVLEISSSSIDFGTILPGASKTETITLSNIGGEALTVSTVDVAGSEFLVENDCTGAAITPNSDCTTNITYTAVEGISTGSVSVSSDGGNASASLTGTGKKDDPIFFELGYTLAGDTYIAASRATVPLSGLIDAKLDAVSGNLTGGMTLNPTSGKFEIIKGWSKYLATAQIQFEPVGSVVGTLVDGKLQATTSAYIKLPKVTKTRFGWINWTIGGGKNCRTAEPVTFNISTIDGEEFSPLLGGNVVGEYTLPKLQNCGPLTAILNLKMAGPGNTINLNLAPNL